MADHRMQRTEFGSDFLQGIGENDWIGLGAGGAAVGRSVEGDQLVAAGRQPLAEAAELRRPPLPAVQSEDAGAVLAPAQAGQTEAEGDRLGARRVRPP